MEQSVSPNGKAYDWTPSKSGYDFVDWYTTTEMNVPYEFDTAINSDVKIYAKFGTATPDEVYGYVLRR